MKNIKNLLLLILATVFTYSCDTNNEVTGYNPDNYNYSTTLQNYSIETDLTTVTNNTFEVIFTPTENGKIYYIAVSNGTEAPTSTEVHSAGNFVDVNAGTPSKGLITEEHLFTEKTVTIYTIFKSVDNFISEVPKNISQTLQGCTPSGYYTGQPNIFNTDFTPFDIVFTPTGNKNEYTLTTTWGPNLIAELTADPRYTGYFLYPSTLKINDDLSVEVTGNGDSFTPGGTGTYRPCEDIIEVTLTQEIFTEMPFTVKVTFTKL